MASKQILKELMDFQKDPPTSYSAGIQFLPLRIRSEVIFGWCRTVEAMVADAFYEVSAQVQARELCSSLTRCEVVELRTSHFF